MRTLRAKPIDFLNKFILNFFFSISIFPLLPLLFSLTFLSSLSSTASTQSIASIQSFAVNQNFSGNQDSSENQDFHSSDLKLESLGETTFNLLGTDYPLKFYKISNNNEETYFYYVKACNQNCPLAIVSEPYEGIDWSNNQTDFKWASKPNAKTGYVSEDIDGPAYPGLPPGIIYYSLKSPQEIAYRGALFIPNQISFMMVFHRFYAGRSLKSYVQDFKNTVNVLNQFPEIDQNRLGFIGTSLGGYIASHAAAEIENKPKALLLISPLLDLVEQGNYLNFLKNRTWTNQNVLNGYLNFFAPFQRRIFAATGGPYEMYPEKYVNDTSAWLAKNVTSPTLLVHDTWDTLVPWQNSQNFYLLNSQNIEPIWYSHKSGIDFDTFNRNHAQESEGLRPERIYPLYFSFLIERLNPNLKTKYLAYHFYDFKYSFDYFRQMQLNGENINWLIPRLKDLCKNDTILINLDSRINIDNITGTVAVRWILNTIWNKKIPENNAQFCSQMSL